MFFETHKSEFNLLLIYNFNYQSNEKIIFDFNIIKLNNSMY